MGYENYEIFFMVQLFKASSREHTFKFDLWTYAKEIFPLSIVSPGFCGFNNRFGTIDERWNYRMDEFHVNQNYIVTRFHITNETITLIHFSYFNAWLSGHKTNACTNIYSFTVRYWVKGTNRVRPFSRMSYLLKFISDRFATH